MPDETITPALTREEWAEYTKPHGCHGRDIVDCDICFGQLDRHSRAALALYGQPFGFTVEDVADERQAYHDAVVLARHYQDMGMETERVRCKERARRHFHRAERIAALLPPEDSA